MNTGAVFFTRLFFLSALMSCVPTFFESEAGDISRTESVSESLLIFPNLSKDASLSSLLLSRSFSCALVCFFTLFFVEPVPPAPMIKVYRALSFLILE